MDERDEKGRCRVPAIQPLFAGPPLDDFPGRCELSSVSEGEVIGLELVDLVLVSE